MPISPLQDIKDREKITETITIKNTPIDLELHEALVENINISKQLRRMLNLIIWVKFFLVFAILIMILILLKAYRVV